MKKNGCRYGYVVFAMVFSMMLAVPQSGFSWASFDPPTVELAADAPDVKKIVFSPDGSLLAGITRKSVTIWSPGEMKEIGRLEGHTADIVDMSVSQDGRQIVTCTTSGDASIRVWDTLSAKSVHNIKNVFNASHVLFAPDKKNIIVIGKMIQVVDPGSGKILSSFEWPGKNEITTVAVSANQKQMATADGWESVIHIWDLNSGKSLKQFKTFDKVEGITFSPDGKMLAYATSLKIYVIDFGSGRDICDFDSFWTKHLVISRGGRFLFGGATTDNYSIRAFSIEKKKEVCPPYKFAQVLSTDLSPNGQFLAASYKKPKIQIWNLKDQGFAVSVSSVRKPSLAEQKPKEDKDALDLKNIDKYVGEYVTITMLDGTVHDGLIKEVDAENLTLEKEKYGGKIFVTLPIIGINKMEY